MKSNTLKLFASAFFAIVLVACTKHAGDEEAETTPTATLAFSSPTEGASYQFGDSVLIQGVAAAAQEMHGYEVSVRNAADTSVVYYKEHIHEHGSTLAINQKWKDTLTTAVQLQAQVTLILDHDGHTTTKSVRFNTSN